MPEKYVFRSSLRASSGVSSAMAIKRHLVGGCKSLRVCIRMGVFKERNHCETPPCIWGTHCRTYLDVH